MTLLSPNSTHCRKRCRTSFYERLIETADARFDAHLEKLKKEREKEKEKKAGKA